MGKRLRADKLVSSGDLYNCYSPRTESLRLPIYTRISRFIITVSWGDWSRGTYQLVCALLILHIIVRIRGDRDAVMVRWNDNGDLVRMDDSETSRLAGVRENALGLRDE